MHPICSDVVGEVASNGEVSRRHWQIVVPELAKAAPLAPNRGHQIFESTISPVESGLIASLARPGGNITGGAAQTAALSTKRLEILKEVVPGLSRGAVLWNGANPALAYPWKLTQSAAGALGVELDPVEVRSPKDIENAFTKMTETRPDAG